jgi:putative transposase
MPLGEKRLLLDSGHPKLSWSRQCRLLSINQSSLYYKPRAASELNLELMRLMDKHYIGHSSNAHFFAQCMEKGETVK